MSMYLFNVTFDSDTEPLKHRVLSCTSEDRGSAVKNLNSSVGSQAKNPVGWLSQPHGEYPISITLELEFAASLHKIQLLSHEYCISSAIDISTSTTSGLSAADDQGSGRFEELGQILLESNERSGYQSRELKTIHMNRVCARIRFLLNAPHKNSLNVNNQVGLLQITCFGEKFEPRVGSPKMSGSAQRDPNRLAQAKVHALEQLLDQANTDGNKASALAIRQRLDSTRNIAQDILALEEEKQEAVRLEDFDLAKRIKSKIDQLRNQLDTVPFESSQSVLNSLTSYIGSTDAPAEAFPDPDPLPPYFVRDYPHLVDALGEQILSLLLSRDWRLRDKGVGEFLSSLNSNPSDTQAISWLVRKLSSEKIVNLIIRLCELLQAVVAITRAGSDASMEEAIEFGVIYLIEQKLIDSNRRLIDAVILTLVKVGESSSVRCHRILNFLFKGAPSTKAITGRCLCLLSMAQTFGFTGKRSINAEALLKTLADWYPRTSPAEARLALMQVLRETIRQIGQDKVEDIVRTHMSGIAKENLLFELNRLPAPTALGPGVACDFCGKTDPAFSLEDNMDVHFWDECPSLIECCFCEQVVELTGLTEHRLKECESKEAVIQ